MGFFSGLFDGVKKVVGAVADPISSVMDIVGGGLNMAAPFMESNSAEAANQTNIEEAARQRAWQHQQNQLGMDFSAGQAVLNRQFQEKNFLTANQFNRDENRIARQWSEGMANTAYQRAVKDMRAAGLNPMLAYSQGGASTPPSSGATAGSTPSGSSASGMSSSGAAASVRPTFSAQSVASAAQAAQLAAGVKNTMADTANKEATADQIRAQTRLIRLQGDTEGYRPGEVTARTGELKASEKFKLDTLLDTVDKIRADAAHSRSSAGHIDSSRVLMKELQANPWLKDWAPYLLDAFRGK